MRFRTTAAAMLIPLAVAGCGEDPKTYMSTPEPGLPSASCTVRRGNVTCRFWIYPKDMSGPLSINSMTRYATRTKAGVLVEYHKSDAGVEDKVVIISPEEYLERQMKLKKAGKPYDALPVEEGFRTIPRGSPEADEMQQLARRIERDVILTQNTIL